MFALDDERPTGAFGHNSSLPPMRKKQSRRKAVLTFWSEWGDLRAFFACGRGEKSKNSSVCALTHAQPAGLCDYDSSLPIEKNSAAGWPQSFLVGVGRLELPASWSRTKRATGCATPRDSFYIIMTLPPLVKEKVHEKNSRFRSPDSGFPGGTAGYCKSAGNEIK